MNNALKTTLDSRAGREKSDSRAEREKSDSRAEREKSDTSANLGEFSRATVQRYLSKIEGHPAAQLHRLIMNEVEKPLLCEVLRHCEGNLTHASELLGINRATLRKKLDDYGIAH
jgi:Fis family transcriptional regulator, factor for inversion stimulation protein